MTGPPIRENAATAAPELSADMTPEDLAFELKNLRFEQGEFRRVLMDRDARDYIVASVNARTRRD